MWVVFTQYKSYTEREGSSLYVYCLHVFVVDPAKKAPIVTSSIWHILFICLSTRCYEQHSEETLGYCSPKPNKIFIVYVSIFLARSVSHQSEIFHLYGFYKTIIILK